MEKERFFSKRLKVTTLPLKKFEVIIEEAGISSRH